MSSLVVTSRDAAITTITLNRPDKRNALNVELLEQLCAAVRSAESDASQRILVLRGAGTVFCSGLDLAEAGTPDFAQRSAGFVQEALHRLATTRLITIAAVQGAAIAGGAGLMSACDFSLATRDAKFGYPEVRRGLVPALIMTFLRRQVRERDARELLLLGKLFDAEHAHQIGLLNRVVADSAALEIEVRTIISSLLQGGPSALAETKKLLGELWPAPLAGDLERAHAHHLGARNSPEALDGVAAFNEKRAPKWAGGD
ncbi:MAG: enoyl-CoA hydratase/isomerase family protein [Opitutaceae bacterium]|nr:enoyl-CoA hydratase/isomerase family protein [Opitutaceae bacterium]